MIILLK